MASSPPAGMFHADMSKIMASSLAPATPLPEGAWDSHCHVFGPFDRHPLHGEGAYLPPLSPADEYVAMLDGVGFSHGVIVQPAAYGYDNSAVLDALKRFPGRLRGIAVVPASTSELELNALHRAGVRGVRITEPIGGRGLLGSELLRLSDLDTIAPGLAKTGLHVQLWAEARQIIDESDRLARLPVPVVFDHFAQINLSEGTQSWSFQALLELLALPHVWMKVQPLRIVHSDEHKAMVRPFLDAVVEAMPGRIVWGSDWPFIAMGLALPHPGKLVDELTALTDRATLKAILVDNPVRLYN